MSIQGAILAGPEGPGNRAKDRKTVGRLLSMRQAAAYLGVSYWLIRDWVLDGVVPAVRLPGSRLRAGGRVVAHSTERNTRKVFIDRQDLDRLVEESKQ